MTQRRPLVYNKGFIDILPIGDQVAVGDSPTEIIAGSGLSGGGSVSSEPRLDFAIAPNPSGLIYVEDTIGNDGVALASSTTALSNITDAISLGTNALASGNSALEIGTAALASGNAALELIPDLSGGGGTNTTLRAGAPITKGCPVGVNDAGEVEQIGISATFSINPAFSSNPNDNALIGTNNGVSEGISTTTVPVVNDYFYSFYREPSNGYLSYTVTRYTGGPNGSFVGTTSAVLYSNTVNSISAIWDGGEYILLTFNNLTVSVAQYVLAKIDTDYSLIVERGANIFVSGFIAGVSNLQLIKKKEAGSDKSYVCFSASNGGVEYFVVGLEINYTTVQVAFNSVSITPYTGSQYIYGKYIEEASSWIGLDINGTLYSCYFNGSSFTLLTATPVQNNASEWYGGSPSCTTLVDFGAPTSTTANTVLFGVINLETNDTTSLYVCSITNPLTNPSLLWGGRQPIPNSSRPANAGYPCRLINTPEKNMFQMFFTDASSNTTQWLNQFVATKEDATDTYSWQSGLLTNVSSFMYPLIYPSLYPSPGGYYAVTYQQSNTGNNYIDLLNPPFLAATIPTQNGLNNYLGAANSTVASGVPVGISLPGTVVQYDGPNLPEGQFIDPSVLYYIQPASGSYGLYTSDAVGQWNGQVEYLGVAKAVNPSGLLLTNCL